MAVGQTPSVFPDDFHAFKHMPCQQIGENVLVQEGQIMSANLCTDEMDVAMSGTEDGCPRSSCHVGQVDVVIDCLGFVLVVGFVAGFVVRLHVLVVVVVPAVTPQELRSS
jgi:hypothetical protein